jgi:adenosylcobinamide-phosphate synthase
MFQLAVILLLAFLLDLFLGDPRYRLHPIRLIGLCISLFTKIFRLRGLCGKWGGILLVGTVQVIFLGAYLTVSLALRHIHMMIGLMFDLFTGYSCLALKDLLNHTDRVVHALEAGDLIEARKRIGMVVGRDVRSLDEKGVCRAAMETLAENFVDGFLSPLFWGFSGGMLGYLLGYSPVMTAISFMLAFKVTSTLDSMVGYKDARFLKFGWAGARLDDIMNFVPARLSLVILFVGAWICRLNPSGGIRTALRDRLKHDSPNSAHAESFVAGALRVQLGGPTLYPEGQKEKPWLGQGNPDPLPLHIRKTGRLLKCAAWVGVIIPVASLMVFG